MTSEKIKELEHEVARLRGTLRTDELTGVLNRRGINEEFFPLFEDAMYTHKHGRRRALEYDDLSIVFVDLDNFKNINDIYGHDAGDTVLETVSALLARSIRGVDRIGRYGGEEFVIVLPGASEDGAYGKASSLSQSIKALSLGEKLPVKLSSSFGVASLVVSGKKTLEELIEAADKAMYEGKHNRGKGTVVKYSELK